MKLYLSTKKMTFEEDDVEHQIISGVWDSEFPGHDIEIVLDDNDKFIKDTLRIIYKKDNLGNDMEEIESKAFITKEQGTWWSFPLYELKNGKIKSFDYTQYAYFANSDRRYTLALKIKKLYNSPSEAKISRKTFKYIMDTLQITYPDFFEKYNDKIEAIIENNKKNN